MNRRGDANERDLRLGCGRDNQGDREERDKDEPSLSHASTILRRTAAVNPSSPGNYAGGFERPTDAVSRSQP